MKLIDLLVKVENGTIDDNAAVIIDEELYYYNKEKKRFYTSSKNKCQDKFRVIHTDGLDLECMILEQEKRASKKNLPEEHNFYSLSKYNSFENENDKVLYLIQALDDLKDKYSQLNNEAMQIANIFSRVLEKGEQIE